MEKGEKWTKEDDEEDIGCMLPWKAGAQPSCYILSKLRCHPLWWTDLLL